MRKTQLIQRIERKIGSNLEDYLRNEYIGKSKPAPKIAEELGVSKNSIIYWLNNLGIPVRTKSEAQSLAKSPANFKSNVLRKVERKVHEPIDVFLRREYENNKKSATELADYFEVNPATLYIWLRNNNIPIRGKNEAQSLAKLPKGFKKPTKKQLEYWYINQHKSASKIGEVLGVTDTTIFKLMREYGIKRRKPSEYYLPPNVKKPSKMELKKQYHIEKKSSNEIADEIGVTSTTVLGWLRDYKIPVRSNSQAQFYRSRKKIRKPTKNQIRKWYHDERKSTGEIAINLGVTQRTIINWMRDYNIPTRSPQEASLPEGIEKLSKSELKSMYIEKGISTVEIAKEIGVKSSSTIQRWLKSYGIKRHKLSSDELYRLYNQEGLNATEISRRHNITRTTVYYYMKKYDITREKHSKLIKSSEQFLSFLKEDNTARNLAGIAVLLDGNRHDIEELILNIYEEKFKDQESLQNIIDQSTDEIYRLIEDGITNLGSFIGSFSLQDKKIIPLLLAETIDNLPNNKINTSLEDKLVRLLRYDYGPRFNENPRDVINDLKSKIESTNGKKRALYKKLHDHYDGTLKLRAELN